MMKSRREPVCGDTLRDSVLAYIGYRDAQPQT